MTTSRPDPIWNLRFSDLEGRLTVIHVRCRGCERLGRYSLAKMIARRGRNASVRAWLTDLTSDCPACKGYTTWYEWFVQAGRLAALSTP
jgi:hypothetical protein